MRRWLFRLLILGVVLGVAAAVVVPAAAWWQQRTAPKYLTATVSRGRVETVVNSTGTIKPVLSVSVGAFTSGPIKEVYVDFNSVVKKGDLLAVIDPQVGQGRRRSRRGRPRRPEGRPEPRRGAAPAGQEQRGTRPQARGHQQGLPRRHGHGYLRLHPPPGRGPGPAAARPPIAQAEATLENSQANLGYTEIRLARGRHRHRTRRSIPARPWPPRSRRRNCSSSPPKWINTCTSTPRSMRPTSARSGHAQDRRARVVKFTVDAYPGDLFEGRIHQIRKNSTTTQNVVTYPVVIEAPNPDLKLLPGMTANLSFQIEAKDDVLRVPAAALRLRAAAGPGSPGGRALRGGSDGRPPPRAARSVTADEKADQARERQHRVVWVQDGRLLRAVPVTLGLIENQYAEVVNGDLNGRPGGRHGDGKPVRAEVSPWTFSTCC